MSMNIELGVGQTAMLLQYIFLGSWMFCTGKGFWVDEFCLGGRDCFPPKSAFYSMVLNIKRVA